jgi:uroporphyrinogen-III synthase
MRSSRRRDVRGERAERRPRLAIFRPAEKLEESVRLAESRGFEVIAVPMLEIREVQDPRFPEFLTRLAAGAVDAVVFSSSGGVGFAFHQATAAVGPERFRDALNGTRVVAIGPATRLVLQRLGVSAELPQEHSSRGVVEHFKREGIAATRVVLLRSRQGSPELIEGLRSLGCDVSDLSLYDVGLPEDLADARAFFDRVVRGEVDAYAFLSTLTVRNFLGLAAALGVEDAVRAALARATVAAIGGPTRETLEEEGVRVAVAPPRATFADLLDALGRNV